MMHSRELLMECAKALSEYCEEVQERTGYECDHCIFKIEGGCQLGGFHKSTKIDKNDFGIEMEIVTKCPSDWFHNEESKCQE